MSYISMLCNYHAVLSSNFKRTSPSTADKQSFWSGSHISLTPGGTHTIGSEDEAYTSSDSSNEPQASISDNIPLTTSVAMQSV